MQKKQAVLIVDDELNVLNSLNRALKSPDYDIITTPDSTLVVEMLYKHPEVDVIISDFNMPEIDGVALLTEVTQLFPHIKRFILSAYQDFNVIVKSLNEGIIHKFYSKPWDVEELKLQIRNALEERSLSKENSKSSSIPGHVRQIDFLDQLDLAISHSQAPLAVVIISLKNVQALYLSCGIKKYNEILEIVSKKIGEFYSNQHFFRMLNESTFGIMIPINEKINEDFIMRELTKLYEFLEQPIELANQTVQLSVHCGVAMYPDHGQSAEYLTRNAHEAAYNSMSKDRKLEVYHPQFPH